MKKRKGLVPHAAYACVRAVSAAAYRRTIAAVLLITAAAALTFSESANITVFRPAVNPRDKNDVMVRAAAEYKAQTGGKVTFVISDWVNWQSKILTYMAAGEPIDVIFARDADFPKFYVKGYLQPLDTFVNLSVPYLNKAGMDMVFKYENQYYLASHSTANHTWIVIYNKSLMEEEGIPESEQPLALYRQGKWTWENLRKLAIKLTKDTAGTGVIDRWGFANWWTRGFAYMNGTGFTRTDAAKNLQLNFDDQRLMEALSFLETAKKEGWYMQDNNIARDGLQKRTIAMFMEREYTPSQILRHTRDELCYVPLPVGPGNKTKANIFETDGYGIGNGSKNPTYAGKFIDICLKMWYDEDMSGREKTWPQEVIDLAKEMEKNPIYPGTDASPLDTMLDQFLGEIVWTGNSPSTAIAGYTAKAEMLIQEANKPMEKPVQLPFKAISIDFEKGKWDDVFKVGSKDLKSVKVQVVSGKEAITKKSLKISMDYKADGEYINAVLTDPEKLAIVGWRKYKVSFDVKALKKPTGDDPYVYFEAYQDEYHKYGWITKKIEAADTVYNISGFISEVNQNGKIPIKIGGHNMTDFVIDNFIIEER